MGTRMTDNPYQAPENTDTPATQLPLWTRISSRWTIVFALNLPLPLVFAMGLAEDFAFLGVLAVIAMLWCVGIVLAQHRPTVMNMLSSGGMVIAVGQFFPIIHIIAGSLALEMLEDLTGKRHDQGYELTIVNTIFDGAFATFVTAGILLSVAGFFGIILQTVTQVRAKVDR